MIGPASWTWPIVRPRPFCTWPELRLALLAFWPSLAPFSFFLMILSFLFLNESYCSSHLWSLSQTLLLVACEERLRPVLGCLSRKDQGTVPVQSLSVNISLYILSIVNCGVKIISSRLDLAVILCWELPTSLIFSVQVVLPSPQSIYSQLVALQRRLRTWITSSSSFPLSIIGTVGGSIWYAICLLGRWGWRSNLWTLYPRVSLQSGYPTTRKPLQAIRCPFFVTIRTLSTIFEILPPADPLSQSLVYSTAVLHLESISPCLIRIYPALVSRMARVNFREKMWRPKVTCTL